MGTASPSKPKLPNATKLQRSTSVSFHLPERSNAAMHESNAKSASADRLSKQRSKTSTSNSSARHRQHHQRIHHFRRPSHQHDVPKLQKENSNSSRKRGGSWKCCRLCGLLRLVWTLWSLCSVHSRFDGYKALMPLLQNTPCGTNRMLENQNLKNFGSSEYCTSRSSERM